MLTPVRSAMAAYYSLWGRMDISQGWALSYLFIPNKSGSQRCIRPIKSRWVGNGQSKNCESALLQI